MKKLLFILSLTALIFNFSCNKKDDLNEDLNDSLITKTTWNQPILISTNAIGYTQITCSQGHKINFIKDGSYSSINYCNDKTTTGTWNWIEQGKKIGLEVYYNEIYQFKKVITIIELTDNKLHTIEYQNDNSEITTEFIYNSRPD